MRWFDRAVSRDAAQLTDDVPEEPDHGEPWRSGQAAAPDPGLFEASVVGRRGVDVHIPDGVELARALARTTDLGIGAHADDLELAMLVPIGTCRRADDRWFAGVTCTDGAGSARSGPYAAFTDDEMVVARAAEQRTAAEVGAYGAMVQLGYTSEAVRRSGGRSLLVDDLVAVLRATRPRHVYTHNLVDKHETHVAVAVAVVEAIRQLPRAERPGHLIGVEGWRDLDWLPDHEKVVLDATGFDELGEQLAACFPSQIEGGKRYDLAASGRRRANATMAAPRSVDAADAVVIGMDLTPLAHNDELEPRAYVLAAIDRFRADVGRGLRAPFDEGP
jgi:hypothetical protein